MKRVLICALVLGLIGVGSGPVSLCALLSFGGTECAAGETQTKCNQMDMNMPSAPALKAITASCCVFSQAPLPESKKSSPQNPTPSVEPLDSVQPVVQLASLECDSTSAPQYSPPSPPQSLLCTFLI